MARTFRRKQQAHPIADLNITNMVDLGFTLLIIFMIAASLIKQEQSIPVNLPTSAPREQPVADKSAETRVISVDAQGRYYLDDQPKAVSVAELRSRLRVYATQAKQPVIRIRGDGEVPYKAIHLLYDECIKLGLKKWMLDDQIGK